MCKLVVFSLKILSYNIEHVCSQKSDAEKEKSVAEKEKSDAKKDAENDILKALLAASDAKLEASEALRTSQASAVQHLLLHHKVNTRGFMGMLCL